MKDYEPGLIENGGKMLILFSIVQQSIAIGEKILVFSQSLFTLSLIENYLSKMNVPWPEGNQEKWAKNKNYYSEYWVLGRIIILQINVVFIFE